MITADELLASPVNLLAHLSKLSPSSAIRDEKLRAERAEELAILKRIASLPVGTHVVMKKIGENKAARAAKRRARDAGLIKRTQSGMSQVWRRTSKEWKE
mgnify:FL=1